jgi:hypothetical protein
VSPRTDSIRCVSWLASAGARGGAAASVARLDVKLSRSEDAEDSAGEAETVGCLVDILIRSPSQQDTGSAFPVGTIGPPLLS